MVDLSQYMKRWSDDRFNWKKGEPRVKATVARFNIGDHMLLCGITWIRDNRGALSDLRFDPRHGGYGKFDKNGNKVIIREW